MSDSWREIAQIDAVVRQLDELREEAGMSKAELARASEGKWPHRSKGKAATQAARNQIPDGEPEREMAPPPELAVA